MAARCGKTVVPQASPRPMARHSRPSASLRVHGAAIQSRESLRMRADRVRDAARKTWEGLDALMQEVRCALGFFGGQHGQ